MSDQIETHSAPTSSSPNQYATQPNAFRPSAAVGQPAFSASNQGAPSTNPLTKPAVLLVALAILAATVFYQQTQINRLNKELGLVSDNLKSSDVRDRLDAQETKLQELNSRMTYLDSKISATNESAQLALSKLKAQEDNDWFGSAIKALKHTLGIQ